MMLLPAIWSRPTPEALWTSGKIVFETAFGLGLAAILVLTWLDASALPVMMLALLAVAAIWYIFRHPLLNLAVVLVLFIAVSNYEEGIQTLEVIYGLYYLTFLGHWFISRILIYNEKVLAEPEDKALFLFLVGATLTFPLTLVFGGTLKGLISEWAALMMLGFYFPVKEACIRHRLGAGTVLTVLLIIGLFATFRNVMIYRAALTDATQAWQVATGRVWMNDNLIMVATLVSLVVVAHSRSWKHLIPFAVSFVLFFISLILTQSRGFWIAFLFGAVVLFFFADRERKRRLILYSAVALAALMVIGVTLFSARMELIVVGVMDRFASVSTAFEKDVSLINRFQESKAALTQIVSNPVLGHGMAVPFSYFDLTFSATNRGSFIHNGYVNLWYKFGLWGLFLILAFWFKSAWKGLRTKRLYSGALAPPTIGFAAAVALVAMVLSAATSNPFFRDDGTLIFGIVAGLAAGSAARSERMCSLSDLDA